MEVGVGVWVMAMEVWVWVWVMAMEVRSIACEPKLSLGDQTVLFHI